MTDTLVHRGPDDFCHLFLDSRDGTFQLTQNGFVSHRSDVSLGHRRLSIIDLTLDGRQPMANEEQNLFVVFNGEIFNYVELRDELTGCGHTFRTRSDTEVILHAYEEWGGECVTRFNGMWALAIWDQSKREMFCSRDRFGIKPFYYRLDDSAFIFASEIKAILPALEGRPRANYSVLADFLIDGSLCRTGDTFFEGIQRLPPAYNLTVSAREVRLSRYWDYPDAESLASEKEPVEAFRHLLDDAIRLRLRSDVPVGVALSGGMDSSSILALASSQPGSTRMQAFTAVFPGQPYDESEYAEIAARASGSELFRIDDQTPNFMEDLKQIVWTMDYPAIDAQVMCRWRLMHLASQHVKVLLEGQGADEMLAGYPIRYFAPYLLDDLGNRVRGRRELPFRELMNASRAVHRQYGKWAWEGFIREFAPTWLPLRRLRRLRPQGVAYTREFGSMNPSRPETLHRAIYQDRLTDLMHFDHATGILPMLLKFGDALSMAFSVESRLPFLDHRLVEFVFRLPRHHKMYGLESKVILRKAMTGHVPEPILARKDKVGFRVPVERWIAENMNSSIRPTLLSKRCLDRGIFDPRKLQKLFDRYARGEGRLERSFFRWTSVELWFRMFIDGEGMPTGRPVAERAANTIR